jgi:hypothetical protein
MGRPASVNPLFLAFALGALALSTTACGSGSESATNVVGPPEAVERGDAVGFRAPSGAKEEPMRFEHDDPPPPPPTPGPTPVSPVPDGSYGCPPTC